LNWGSPQNFEINVFNEKNQRMEIKPIEKELTADEKLDIELQYAAYLQKQVNKWPRKYPLNS
jgi:hypothetical protein